MAHPVSPPDFSGASDDERARLERVWDHLGDVPLATTDAETDAAWERLSARVDLDPVPTRLAANRPSARRQRPRVRPRWAAAAAALAVLALAVWTVPSLTAPISVQAASGETQAVTLPDGSVVTLAPGSRLSYAKRFGVLVGSPEARRVVLVGEGAFDVESAAAPFVVETFNARVEVLGTRFAVRGHWREAQTRVTVEEGSVRVDAAGASVRLGADQATIVSGDGAPPTAPEAANAGRALAWTTGGLAFDALPLADAFREIERRYGVKVQARGAALGAGAEVTAFYADAPNVRTVLGDLCAAHGLRFEATSQGFAVSADRPPVRQRPGASVSTTTPR